MEAVEAAPPAKPSQLRETLDKLKTKLPPTIANSVTALELHATTMVASGSKQLDQLSSTGQQQLDALRQNRRLKSLQSSLSLEKAFSVRNETQLALNISLNVRDPRTANQGNC